MYHFIIHVFKFFLCIPEKYIPQLTTSSIREDNFQLLHYSCFTILLHVLLQFYMKFPNKLPSSISKKIDF